MVERCKYCGDIMRPEDIIVAHKGLLYCSKSCATKAATSAELRRISDTFNLKGDYDTVTARMIRVIHEEAEEVRACDLGITAPLCPFMFAETDRHECTSECVAYYDGKCSIAETFIRRMEEE